MATICLQTENNSNRSTRFGCVEHVRSFKKLIFAIQGTAKKGYNRKTFYKDSRPVISAYTYITDVIFTNLTYRPVTHISHFHT